jgi:competence protein ComEA
MIARKRRISVQELALIAVVVTAVVAGGVILWTDRSPHAANLDPVPIVFHDVAVIAPTFADGPSLVDINASSAEELQRLPGIGPVLAERIVTYRVEHGPFGSVEELIAVNGIGEHTVDGLRDQATVAPADQ